MEKLSLDYQWKLNFYSKEKGKPDDITLTDVGIDILPNTPIPNVGDFITHQYAYPLNIRGNYGTFKVIARHFFINRNIDTDTKAYMTIYIIVEEANENEIGYHYKD